MRESTHIGRGSKSALNESSSDSTNDNAKNSIIKKKRHSNLLHIMNYRKMHITREEKI